MVAKSVTIGSTAPLIVVGLEADIQGALEQETSNLIQDFSHFSSGTGSCYAFYGCRSLTSYTTQVDWFGTVRGRIGYVWSDGAVPTYVTGGLAYGEVKINGTNNVNGLGLNNLASASYSNIQTFGQTHVNTGWVVGFGTEGKLLIPGWTLKAEALYMDLGHLDTTGVTSVSSCACAFPLSGGQVITHSHFTDSIFRIGLNYQFH